MKFSHEAQSVNICLYDSDAEIVEMYREQCGEFVCGYWCVEG